MRPTTDIIGKQYRDFNDFLKIELKRQHISQQTLSEWLNFNDRQYLVDRLSGKTAWKFHEYLEVCYFLNHDFADVLKMAKGDGR